MAGLVAAAHVVRVVLHPHATIGGEPQLVAERIGSGERGGDEPVALHRGHLRVELGHHRCASRRREAGSRGEAVPREVWAEREERVRLVGPISERYRHQRRRALHQLQHVVAIVARTRAAPRERHRDVDRRAAHRARPPGHHRLLHHEPAATCWLNSVIMPSHTGSRRRRPCQNDWWRRASNSSNGVFCCSTHV